MSSDDTDPAPDPKQALLSQRRDKLDLVAKRLIEQETLDGATFRKLLGMK